MSPRNTLARAGTVGLLLFAIAGAAAWDWLKPHQSVMAVMAAQLAMAAPAAPTQKATPQTHTVLIKNFEFQPATLTVKAGNTVLWKNEDIVPHTATANGKRFDSKSIESKASWKYVASKPGTYPYICAFHPTMKAKLIVQ